VDEYFTSLPISTVMHEHAMLAQMNGETLPLIHGYPLAILPECRQKQPKWVTGIKVTDSEELGLGSKRAGHAGNDSD
jgi:DMSO/TMAO reductase YedYZ molybdopterin-dependent catalytic subunit